MPPESLRHESEARQVGGIAMWNQVYNPFNSQTLSTIAAALPVVTLLALIASNKVKAHIAAVIALIVANLVAIFLFTMPAGLSIRATILGAAAGLTVKSAHGQTGLRHRDIRPADRAI